MALPPPSRYPQNALDEREAFIGDCGWLDILFSQIPRERHDPPKLLELPGMRFPRTSGPKPVILLGLYAVISTYNDVPLETLEVVRVVTVEGVLHYVSCSELLHCDVGEVKQAV